MKFNYKLDSSKNLKTYSWTLSNSNLGSIYLKDNNNNDDLRKNLVTVKIFQIIIYLGFFFAGELSTKHWIIL